MTKIFAKTAWITLLILPLNAHAQDSLGVHKVSSLYNFSLYAVDVEIAGNYGYIAGGKSGVWVVDLADLDGYHPPISRTDEPMNVLDVLADYTLLYVGDEMFGLRVFDISNPELLEEIGRLRVWGQPCDLFLDQSTLYIAAGDHGMRRIDVSDPRNPRETGFYNHLSTTYGVYVSGRCAYLADYNRGFKVIELSNQLGFRQIFNLGNYAARDILSWNNQIIALTANRFDAFDPSQPDNPRLISGFPQAGHINFEDATIVGNNFLGIDHWGLFYLIDLNSAPNYDAETLEIGFRCIGIDADAERVLMAAGENGIKSYIYEDGANPTYTGYSGDRGHCYESVIDGNYLYLALGEGGFEIFDMSDPLDPERISVTRTPDDAINLFIHENLLYVALLRGGILSVDVSDKKTPRIINRFDEFGFVSDLVFTDTVAVMYCDASEQYSAGIYTFNYRDPEDIVVLGSVPVDNIRGINFTVANNKVYFVAGNNWFFNLDISDPSEPIQSSFLPSNNEWCHGRDIRVRGEYAYASFWDVGLVAIDVRDPGNMATVSTLDYRWPDYLNRMQIVDSLLYVEDNGVRVFSLAEPTRPREIGHYTGGIAVTGMAAKENYVYLSTLSQVMTFDCNEALGVEQDIGELQHPQEMALTVSPNPFNASATVRFSIPNRTGYKLNLYDHSGKLVRQIATGINNPGEHNETLDASSLSTGVYFINLKTETSSITRKALVMK